MVVHRQYNILTKKATHNRVCISTIGTVLDEANVRKLTAV